MSDQLCPRCKAESETLHTLCACSACGATIRASREVIFDRGSQAVCRACASRMIDDCHDALMGWLDDSVELFPPSEYARLVEASRRLVELPMKASWKGGD